MTKHEGMRRLDALADGTPIATEGVESSNLPRLAEECIGALNDVRNELANINSPAEFDAQLAVALHSSAELNYATTTDLGYWRWLALEHGRDLIVFRYGEDAGYANFGLGPRWENLLLSSWFRAELSHDPGRDDPYSLTKRGRSDFWASGVIRRRYASARNLVRALVRFQFPHDDPFRGKLHTDNVRELYKRIRRMQATVAFELLSDDECDELLRVLADDLAS